ncbi:MAG: NAD-dependent epimerase/dehydratase family protein, partial [Pseudolysinimonas sp.]
LAVVLGPVLIYLLDTSSTLVRRQARGDQLATSHRDHVYQRLALRKMGHVPAALLVTGFSAAAAAIGLIALQGSGPANLVAFAGFALLGVAYLLLPRWILGSGPDVTDPPVQVRPQDPARRFSSRRWVVAGATGFVGRALIEELRSRGIHVDAVNAPRLTFDPAGSREAADQAISGSAGLEQFARTLQDVDVVVNAAGIADAGARSGASLFGANALLPLWLARAADLAGVDRMIHISSAAVQGRAPVLDESPVWAPFSPYSASKARGEEFLLGSDFATTEVVIVRATSVQGAERPTTIRLRKLARSWVASVARPGDRPTVVSSIDGLTAFVASVGGHPTSTPAIVLQPWEGLTTTDVLVAAGRRRPRMIPALVCRMVIGAGYLAAAVVPGLAGAVRRVELMWLGQAQDAAWARAAGLVVAPGVRDVLGGARESAS